MRRTSNKSKGPRKPITYYGDASRAGQRIPIKVKRQLAKEEEECKIDVPFTRTISLSGDNPSRSLPYRRRKFEWKPPLHWGQIKLFTAELEFITKYAVEPCKIVYAGSSDGRHIPYLANMFPDHMFQLWDPAPMYSGWRDLSNIEFHQELFTEDIARKEFGNPESHDRILFISDIRSMPEGFDYANMTADMDQEIEQDVKKDMHLQRVWCKIMRPRASILKFRLPYTPGESEYLDGDLYFQAFASETSSECRLVIDNERHAYRTRMYNHEEYENIMYRFNRCTRVQELNETAAADEEIKKAISVSYTLRELFEPVPLSYDVMTLVYVVQKYIKAFDPEALPGEIIYHLLNYTGSNFQKKYNIKKKITEKHMDENKTRHANGEEVL